MVPKLIIFSVLSTEVCTVSKILYSDYTPEDGLAANYTISTLAGTQPPTLVKIDIKWCEHLVPRPTNSHTLVGDWWHGP